MFERTITIGSAGKTFSVTGWKIGWAYGPENLLSNLKLVHQNAVDICNTPTQVNIFIIFYYGLLLIFCNYFTNLYLKVSSAK